MVGVFVLCALFLFSTKGFASTELDGSCRDKAAWRAHHRDGDDAEVSSLLGGTQHANFYMKYTPFPKGASYSFEDDIKKLEGEDQSLVRLALMQDNGCPDWAQLPMNSKAGRARATSVFRVLSRYYAHQMEVCVAPGPQKGLWSVKQVALGLSYGQACGQGERLQEDEDKMCCCLFFWTCGVS